MRLRLPAASTRFARSAPRAALFCLVAVVLLLPACRESGDADTEALGTLELVETAVAPLVTARVERMLVEEGAAVRAGDTIAVLALPTTSAELAQRRSQAAAAAAAAADLEAGARRAELDRLAAELRAFEEEAERAAREAAREERLVEAGAISRQEYDRARTAADVAAARRDAAAEALRLARAGTRPDQVQSAQAQAAAARAAEQAARASADALVLLAPSAGVVVARHAEPGEILPAGQPAVTLGDPTRPWVRVYVSPDVFPFLEVGDTASAVLDALPGRPVAGTVTALATRAEFTPRVALTESERADLLFGVRVEFTDTTGLLKAGLPVTVRLPRAAERRRLAARDDAGGGA